MASSPALATGTAYCPYQWVIEIHRTLEGDVGPSEELARWSTEAQIQTDEFGAHQWTGYVIDQAIVPSDDPGSGWTGDVYVRESPNSETECDSDE